MKEDRKKTKLGLDESRMLILGTSILLGFQFRAVFEEKFESLPTGSQYAELVALLILLLTILLIMWPGSYHRLVWQGNESDDLDRFITFVMDMALFPFSIALGIEFYVYFAPVVGVTAGLVSGSTASLAALFLFYGIEFISVYAGWDRHLTIEKKGLGMKVTELSEKVEEVLIEARVVLPGTQALLGFQFAAILSNGFEKLPETSKYIHLGSLALMGLSVMMLMTPAAYHRIVEKGEATEHFHRIASVLLLLAMVTFPLGVCGDLYVVVLKTTGSGIGALICACVTLLFFYVAWFGYTTLRRMQIGNVNTQRAK